MPVCPYSFPFPSPSLGLRLEHLEGAAQREPLSQSCLVNAWGFRDPTGWPVGSAQRERLDKAFGSPSTVTASPQFTQDFLSGSIENPSPRSSANWDRWLPYVQGPLYLLIYSRLPLLPGQPGLWTFRCQALHIMWAWRDLWLRRGPRPVLGSPDSCLQRRQWTCPTHGDHACVCMGRSF